MNTQNQKVKRGPGWRSALTRMAVATCLGLAGCALDTQSSELATAEQEFRCDPTFGSPNDNNCPWKSLSRLKPATDINHYSSPGLCAGDGLPLVTVTVDSASRYRVMQSHTTFPANWAAYGTRTFSSRPTCVYRELDTSVEPDMPGIVIAGRSTDGKIYASAGTLSPLAPNGNIGNNPLPLPGLAGQFTAVSSQTYNVNGFPSMFVGANAVLMAFLGDDNRTVYAHTTTLPYASNTWSPRMTGPVLPSGWTAVGGPSIARRPVTFIIVVHAKNAQGESRLFETHFYLNGGIRHFSNSIGTPPASWVMLPSLGGIEGEPAVTYHPELGTTVFFRGTPSPAWAPSPLIQTGAPWTNTPVFSIKPNENIDFDSSPAAVSTYAPEANAGRHTVVARTGNQLRVGHTFNDSQLDP